MDDFLNSAFQGLDISASGLRAEMQRSEIVSANLGNMHRTGNKHHEPYRRKAVVFEEVLGQAVGTEDPGVDGARVGKVVEDHSTPFPRYQSPGHPDADEDGWVWGSNVDMFQELVDLSVIERSFDANLAAMRTYRTMLQNTVTNLGRS